MKSIIKSIALLLAAALALGAAACAGKSEKTPSVMSLGEFEIDENEYRYLYATYKARYIADYSVAHYFKDSDDFWEEEFSNGVTNAAHFDSVVRDSIRMHLVAERLFDELDLKLSDNTLAELTAYEDDLVAERFDGDREKFEVALAELGASVGTFRAALENGEKMATLFEHYLGANGCRPITDADRANYYRENYVHFAQINVNNRFGYAEEDGEFLRDENGNLVERTLTEEEKAEKNRVISEISEALDAGATVQSIYSEYSENKDYPGGYYFKKDVNGKYDQRIIDAALSLAVGEHCRTDTQYGAFWIERLALSERGWAQSESADFFDSFEDEVKNEVFDSLLKSHFNEISENSDKVAAIGVAGIKANYDLY